MNSDAWRSAPLLPSHQLVHSQLTQHSLHQRGQPVSLPVNAPGTYWARRQPRISPSEGLQTCSRLVRCWHQTPGPKLTEMVGGGSCPRPQVLKAHSHSSASCATARDSEARRAPESFPLSTRGALLTSDYDKCRLGVIQRQPRGECGNKIPANSVFIIAEAPRHRLSAPPYHHHHHPAYISATFALVSAASPPLQINVWTLLGVQSPLIVHSSFLFANYSL